MACARPPGSRPRSAPARPPLRSLRAGRRLACQCRSMRARRITSAPRRRRHRIHRRRRRILRLQIPPPNPPPPRPPPPQAAESAAAARGPAAAAQAQHEREQEGEHRKADRRKQHLADDPGQDAREARGRGSPADPAQHGAQDRGDEDHADEERRQHAPDRVAPALPPGIRRRQRLAIDDPDDLVDPGAQAGVILALPEQRDHGLIDDAVAGRVGQRAFEAVAHLDARRAIVLGEQHEHAVVGLGAPELPLLDHADRVLLDVLGLRRGHDQHRDLRALARLEGPQLLFEIRLLARGQRAGQVRDPRLELRDRLERPAAPHPARPSGRQRQPREHEPPARQRRRRSTWRWPGKPAGAAGLA